MSAGNNPPAESTSADVSADVSALQSRLEETEFRLQNLIHRQTALELNTTRRSNPRIEASDAQEAQTQCVEQLARAYIHLRNVYMSNMKTETACFDSRKIGEWLASLRDAVPESVYQAVLERGNELDMKNYGTRVSCGKGACGYGVERMNR